MQEVTIYSLNTKLREINKSFPLVDARLAENTTNDYLYHYRNNVCDCCNLKKTGNCKLSEKHLNKKGKSKSIGQFPHNEGIELKDLDIPQKLTTLRLLSCTSTNNSLKSMAQRELPQLPNTSQNLPDSPFLQYYQIKVS